MREELIIRSKQFVFLLEVLSNRLQVMYARLFTSKRCF
jgi:hypothetical protein